LCKWKFVACPFVDEETNESYPFASGLNGLARLCQFAAPPLLTIKITAFIPYTTMGDKNLYKKSP
jgi:hypothetical protein